MRGRKGMKKKPIKNMPKKKAAGAKSAKLKGKQNKLPAFLKKKIAAKKKKK